MFLSAFYDNQIQKYNQEDKLKSGAIMQHIFISKYFKNHLFQLTTKCVKIFDIFIGYIQTPCINTCIHPPSC